jgi:hypothetical protein
MPTSIMSLDRWHKPDTRPSPAGQLRVRGLATAVQAVEIARELNMSAMG